MSWIGAVGMVGGMRELYNLKHPARGLVTGKEEVMGRKVRAVKDIVDYTTDEVIAEAGTEFDVFDTEGPGQVWVEYGDVFLLTEDEYEEAS